MIWHWKRWRHPMFKDVHSEIAAPLAGSDSPAPSFHDLSYLSAVISHLKNTRLANSIEIGSLSRKAAIKHQVIQQAESGQRIPDSSQLKAWSHSLGIPWETLWRDALPQHSNPC